MKKLLSLVLVLCIIASMVVLPVHALEPIAKATINGKTTNIYSLDDLILTILPDGNTEITLLQDLDVTGKQALLAPYSFTLDLNGFTLSASEDGIRVAASGYRNPVAVIKNGVIRSGGIGVRVDNGGLRMENVTVYAHGASPAVTFYEIRDTYSYDNIIVGCTLVSAQNSAISFDHPTEKQSKVGVTVRDSRLIAALPSGHTVVTANSGGGFVRSGAGTEFYTYKAWTFGSNAATGSIGNTTTEKGVCDITVDELDLSLNGINKWIYRDNGSDIMTLSVLQTEGGTVTLPKYTAAVGEIITATITPDPGMVFKHMVVSDTNHTATFVVPNHSSAEVTIIPVFASAAEHTGEVVAVTTDGNTRYSTGMAALPSMIDPSGRSTVTLLADITINTGITLPYSCTIDLNGHTLRRNDGNVLAVSSAGSESPVTLIKNGVIDSSHLAVKVSKGALQMERVTVRGEGYAAVCLGETDPQYNSSNLITDCTLYSAGLDVFQFQNTNGSPTGVSMTIQNTKLIAAGELTLVVSSLNNGGGEIVHLGENVDFYSRYSSDINSPHVILQGGTLKKSSNTVALDIAELGIHHADMHHWYAQETAEPIASITTGNRTVYPNSLEDLVIAIDPSGNSKIKLLSDVERTVIGSSGQIILPYTCEIDLNGHTWSNINSTSGNAIKFANVGSQNSHAIVKNGTVLGASVCVSSDKGSVEVRNCVLYSPKSIGVSIYVADEAFNSKNLIEDCTILAGGDNGVFSFQGDNPMNGAKMTIRNSTLAQVNGAGYVLNNKAGGSCTVELGENVHLYAVSEDLLVAPGITVTGAARSAVEGTHTVYAADYSHSGLKKWTTGTSTPAPSNAIATVTTNGTTVNVNTVAELTAAVSRTGKSQVKLLKDITHSSVISFPYVCTVDFNGHTVTTNLSNGNGLEFQQIGTENVTAVVKNGRLVHYEMGILLTKGSLIVDNMVIDSMNGTCVAAYDDTTTRSVTVLDSRLSSKNYTCLSFNKSSTDLSNFIFIVKNSTLVSYKNANGSYSAVIGRNGTATLPGSIVLGEGVEMYSYYNSFDKQPFSETVFTRVFGEPLTLASGTHSVTVGGQTLSGLRKWTTPATAALSPVAAVTNNGMTEYPTTLEEMLSLVQPDGLTKITLLDDVERVVTGNSGQIILPYTCEIDLNSHTWSNVRSTSGNAIKFNAVGTKNSHAVVKNGTILAASVGVSIMDGSLELRSCTIVSPNSIGVSMYSTSTAFNSKNLIENSVILAGGKNGAFSFQGEMPMDGVKMRIVNSTVAQVNGTGYTLNSYADGAGIVELGENVYLYAVSEAMLKHSAILLQGNIPSAQGGTHTLGAAGYSYPGLKLWSTPAVSSDTIATVTTGSSAVNVRTVAELQNAISSTGNSVVKLVKDVTYTASSIQLPYSCTIDFDGHTLRTNSASGNCIQILAAGVLNPVTTLKNGTMVYHTVGVRVDGGAIVVSNMTMHGLSGAAVGIYDTNAAYKSLNRIEDSTLIGTEWGVVSFNKTDADFSNTGITVENSTLVALKPEGTHVFVRQSTTVGGTITLGEGVKLYSYRDTAYAQSTLTVEGIVLEKAASPATFTHTGLGLAHSGMTLWQSMTGVTGVSIVLPRPQTGTVYVPSLAVSGSTVTVTVVPDEGYEFSHLLVNGQRVNGLSFTAPQSGIVKLSGVFEKPQPKVIASITTGSSTVEVTNLEDLIAAVDPSGLSVITLLSDVERVVIGSTGQIVLPYSCTVDLNGFTWSNVRSTSGNALKIDGIGTQNTHSVVKNGTVLGASVGVSCTEGSLEVRNCTIVSPASVGVSIYTTNPAYNEKNLIDGCTIIAGGRGAFSYHLATAAQPGIKMTIRNSTLAQVNGENCTLNSLVGGGDLYLGSNVTLYSVSEATLVHDSITLKGKSLTAQNGTHTVSAAGYSYSGLKKWTTPEGVTATFSQTSIPDGAIGWAAAYDDQQRMLYMGSVESVCGVLSIDIPADIAEAAAEIKLFILQGGALSPLQAPAEADSEPSDPEPPTDEAPWEDIPCREAEDFTSRLFGAENEPFALSLRYPADWTFEDADGAAMTIVRDSFPMGRLEAGVSGADPAWIPVSGRTVVMDGMKTHEWIEQTDTEGSYTYRVRFVYTDREDQAVFCLTMPLTECGTSVRSSLYVGSNVQQAATDPGMGTLSSLQGQKFLILGNSFIETSEIQPELNTMFINNQKDDELWSHSVGYATAKSLTQSLQSGGFHIGSMYKAVFMCGLYSSADAESIKTAKEICEDYGAQLILLPAHNESRTAILQAAEAYPDIPILDWKAEIDAFIASGQDKWDFCINDSHLHSTPLAGYVGAHMIYRAIYGECPTGFSGSVTEATARPILGDYIETGVLQLMDPSQITILS